MQDPGVAKNNCTVPGGEMKQPGGQVKQPVGRREQPNGRRDQQKNPCQFNTERTGSRRVNLEDSVVLREADLIRLANSWSGPSSRNIRRSDGEPITGEPSPRVMTSSLGWVTPPRMARTSARDAKADPEVTTFPEVGGNDISHDLLLSESMLSEQPEVTVTITPGEASSSPIRENCSRRKPSCLDKFKL